MLIPPQEALHDAFAAEMGLNFNGGRPSPPADWMIEKETYAQENGAKQSLELLGNCVVPHQAVLAASILANSQ